MPKSYDYDVSGLKEIEANINLQVKRIKGKTKAGLYEAGLFIERESEKRTPVDTGNLKAGTYAQLFKKHLQDIVEIGYQAHYAPHVHEQVENNHPVGQAKFLEDALKDNERKIVEIIRNRAEVD